MRLHRLRITAFGPFGGSVEVDFDALADAGLFLIHGPTGAGKTSVLDAVCFALYGRVPGVRHDAKSLRSDHAAADQAPQVTLEVTIRGRRLRITRTPSWHRPKKRGTGFTTEQARVTVEELVAADEWVARSTRLDEAGHLIGGLLGMSAEQFCQVAMLPQGEFASFLRAGAEERRKVLERLFATEIFTQVERWLADRRTETGRAAEQRRIEAESVADRIAEAAGADRLEAAEPDDLLPWSTELTGHLQAIRVAVETRLAEAADALTAARTVAERDRELAARRRRHAEAEQCRRALDEQAVDRAALATRLAAAAQADRVTPLLAAVTDRSTQLSRARAATHRALTAAGDLVSAGDVVADVGDRPAADRGRTVVDSLPVELDSQVLRKEERARRDEAVAVETLYGTARRLREVTQEVSRIDAETARLDEREAALGAALAELPDRREGLRHELAEAQTRLAARPGAESMVEAAKARLAAAERRDALTGAVAEVAGQHQAAVDSAQNARDRLQEIRQARLEGMAARLAESLASGEPCKVCGSMHHPEPAAGADGVPSDGEEEAAEAGYEQAQTVREETGARLAELGAELEAEEKLAGDADAAALADELDAAEQALAALDGAEIDADRLTAELQRVESELEEARDRHAELVRSLAEVTARRTELAGEAERAAARIDEARGDDLSLEARAERLAHEAGLIGAAADALDLVRTADTELRATEATAATAARAAGFASLAGASEAALTDADRGELQRRARGFDDEEAAVRAVLDDPDLVAAAAQPAPDLERSEAALAVATEAHTAISAARDRAHRRCERMAELGAQLTGRIASWRPAAEQYAVAARLAGLAAGNPAVNRLSMRLSAYVLAARLEQVVAAANERLARMSTGRYALLHTVEKAAGDRRGGSGGLGLRVADAWTGQERDPVTLSGGESFITSLALALGLADVVTAEAGGAEIGSLFVDEGFGTLDEDTLDEVMDVLDGLRDGGRVVGIVSHVAELRSRIPAQLHVSKARTGSNITVTA